MPSVVTKYGATATPSNWTGFTAGQLGAESGTYAFSTVDGDEAYLSDFGFAVPANATITNLRVEARGYVTSDGVADLSVYPSGQSIAAAATTESHSVVTFYKDYGAWPTIATLNGAGFGVACRPHHTSYLDYVSLIVTYTQPPSTTTASAVSFAASPAELWPRKLTTSPSSASASSSSARMSTLHRPYFSATMVQHYGVTVLEQDQ
jgi:hypothetical protein